MSNKIKINDKPVTIGVFLDDGFITIETEQKQLLGLTRSDAERLINALTEKLQTFDSLSTAKGVSA